MIAETFSVKTSVTALKCHIYNIHEQVSNIKANRDNTKSNMENEIISENEIYKKFIIAFAKNGLAHSLIEDDYFRDTLNAIKTNQ